MAKEPETTEPPITVELPDGRTYEYPDGDSVDIDGEWAVIHTTDTDTGDHGVAYVSSHGVVIHRPVE